VEATQAVKQATVVQLVDEHLAGAILVAVAVHLDGAAVVVVAHLAGEVVPLPEAARLVGVVMVDALLMAEETDHALLMAVVMALEQLTAAQLLMEAPHLTVERQHTAPMTETVLLTVASTQVVVHLVGVAREETLPRNLVVSLLLRQAHTTPQHLVLTPHLLLVVMVHTLRLRQEDHLWMLLHLATMLRPHLVIHRVVDTVLRRLHQVRGMLQRQHLVAILGTTRDLVSCVR
jgi:hypothetical protein